MENNSFYDPELEDEPWDVVEDLALGGEGSEPNEDFTDESENDTNSGC